MPVLYLAALVHEDDGGQAAQFVQSDFLIVLFGHLVVGIRQSHKGIVLAPPVRGERFAVFGADDEYGGAEAGKLIVVVAQLRQVPAAEWSGEAAIENEDDMLVVAVVGQGNAILPHAL